MTPPELLAPARLGERAIYDVLGIGLGPANLALAVSLEEQSRSVHGRDLRCLFLERKPNFCWHPGMLLNDVRIQNSFVKDLATLRDPRSRFTFLSYLHERGRLSTFLNLRTFNPTRREYNDYYTWAASLLSDRICYGAQVCELRPFREAKSDAIELIEVITRDAVSGREQKFLGRNIVVATGGIPAWPTGVVPPARTGVFHSSEFLLRIDQQYPDRDAAYRFVVVGSGQSAAEIFHYLMTHYPGADVSVAMRGFAFKPADATAFVNEIFDPQTVDLFQRLSATRRAQLLATHRDTNYSVVDTELIDQLYRALYNDRLRGTQRHRIRPLLDLTGVSDTGDAFRLEFQNLALDQPEFLDADGVVLATGYERSRRLPLLEQLSSYLDANDQGEYHVGRCYRLAARPNFTARVFMQGFCEHSHGLSDTLLSDLPIRAEQILRAMHAPMHAS